MKGAQEIYRGHRLTAAKHPTGGWQVEIDSIPGGKPVLTMVFRELSDAMDEARRIVDRAG